MTKKTLTILHLYPNDMNIYGDNGNLQVLVKRSTWHGYEPLVIPHNPGDTLPDLSMVDIIIGGGGQDSGQEKVNKDLLSIGAQLKTAVDQGMPTLVVCGLYQLFGKEFITHTGATLAGIGIFDARTIGGNERLVGNISIHSDIFGTIVGYENHSGQTFLGETATALGEVRLGAGNNQQDGNEGVFYKNAIGTYLHGPILPKNPTIADYLISTALKRRYGDFEGVEIDDQLALIAKKVSLSRPR